MSRLISKLVLTILLFPLASLLYIIIFAIYCCGCAQRRCFGVSR